MRDPVLVALAGAADGSGIGLPVTLFVAGSTVEGVIVSEPKWMDRLAEILEAPGTPGTDMVAGVFREIRMTVELDSIAGPGARDFIHLVDVVMRTGEQLQSEGLWRIRLDAVLGWKLGSTVPGLRAVEG